MSKLRKGDTVEILSGKDRGKRGKILAMLPKQDTALVERLNLTKHFERRSQTNQAGGVLERESPIAVEKLAVVCPRCNKSTRVGFGVKEGAAKQRTCKRCNEAIAS